MTRRSILRIFMAAGLVLLVSAGAAYWWMREDHTLKGRLVDYHEIYDRFWDVACDTAMDGSDRMCYVQYVDVYRPRPEFAAAMVEVVVHQGEDGQPDPHIRYDIEPGLSFEETSVFVEGPDGRVPIDVSACRSNTCRFSGQEGRDMLALWRSGTALHLEIEEGRGDPARLAWPLGRIDEILDDFAAQRASRGLP